MGCLSAGLDSVTVAKRVTLGGVFPNVLRVGRMGEAGPARAFSFLACFLSRIASKFIGLIVFTSCSKEEEVGKDNFEYFTGDFFGDSLGDSCGDFLGDSF